MNDKTTSRRSTAKPYPRRCAECGKVAVSPATIAYNAEVKHDGKLHQFHIPSLKIDKCQTCGEEFFTNTTDEQISASLRSCLGLLQPDEIRHHLNAMGISQRTFAEHLRIASETVSRWVTGLGIQNRALDTLMRLYFAFPDVRAALTRPGPLSKLGFEDLPSTDCEANDRPNESSQSATHFFAAAERAVVSTRCFHRPFPANVLARSQKFRLVAAELN